MKHESQWNNTIVSVRFPGVEQLTCGTHITKNGTKSTRPSPSLLKYENIIKTLSSIAHKPHSSSSQHADQPAASHQGYTSRRLTALDTTSTVDLRFARHRQMADQQEKAVAAEGVEFTVVQPAVLDNQQPENPNGSPRGFVEVDLGEPGSTATQAFNLQELRRGTDRSFWHQPSPAVDLEAQRKRQRKRRHNCCCWSGMSESDVKRWGKRHGCRHQSCKCIAFAIFASALLVPFFYYI